MKKPTRVNNVARIKKYILAICFCSLFFIFSFQNTSASSNCSLGISTAESVTLNLRPGTSGVATSDIMATTDCVGGYTIFINGPQDATLYHNGDNTSQDYISTVSGTKESPTILSTDTYGYSLGNIAPNSNAFIGLTSTRTILTATDSASPVGGETYTVSYGASVTNGKKAGLYQMADNGSITYSIIANNIFTVTFDANGGVIPAAEHGEWQGSGDVATKVVALTEDSTYGDLPTPTRNGYTFLGWSTGLPSEYQAVEYIVFDGGQYIDTDIIPTNHTTEVKFSNDSNRDMFLFSTSAGGGYYEFQPADGTYYYGTNGTQKSNGTHIINVARTVIYNGENGLVSVDGEQIGIGGEILSDKNLIIGSRGTSSSYRFNGKLYYLKITEKETGMIVRDYVPCYRKSDSVIGLYDVVNNVFYTNRGSGTFDKGGNIDNIIDKDTKIKNNKNHTLIALWGHNPVVTFDAKGGQVNPASREYGYNAKYGELPIPIRTGYRFLGWKANLYIYQKIHYITVSGAQYIDTNISTTTTKVNEFVLGFRANNSNGWTGINGSMQLNISGSDSEKKLYRVTYDGTTGIQKRYIQGELVNTNSWGVGNYLGPLYLGKMSNYNKGAGISGDIYSFEVYEDNELVRDFIPCYRITDKEVLFYDRANDVFYQNQGTGNFIKSNDVANGIFYSPSESTLVTPEMQMATNEDHMLYAIWEEE